MQNKRGYPENWADEIRPSILKRDGYRCKRCGIKHRQNMFKTKSGNWVNIDPDEVQDYRAEGFRVKKVFLQVAHINNIKMDCNPDNLITLCPEHHLQLDKRFKILKNGQ
jgi:hypothetical protein